MSCSLWGRNWLVYIIQSSFSLLKMGWDSAVGIATVYGLDGPGIESRCERDFPHPSRPALWPTQPPVQWVPGLSPGVKRPGRGADHPPPSKCRGHERVGLYLYSPSGPQWPVIWRSFTFCLDNTREYRLCPKHTNGSRNDSSLCPVTQFVMTLAFSCPPFILRQYGKDRVNWVYTYFRHFLWYAFFIICGVIMCAFVSSGGTNTKEMCQ